mmetsp:Transcript_48121/g.127415  ORF Transcript_48121/g.127415 Transcript_48121/m.127415 type:complete len:248 (-) Transcript_48121:82-825(-)
MSCSTKMAATSRSALALALKHTMSGSEDSSISGPSKCRDPCPRISTFVPLDSSAMRRTFDPRGPIRRHMTRKDLSCWIPTSYPHENRPKEPFLVKGTGGSTFAADLSSLTVPMSVFSAPFLKPLRSKQVSWTSWVVTTRLDEQSWKMSSGREGSLRPDTSTARQARCVSLEHRVVEPSFTTASSSHSHQTSSSAWAGGVSGPPVRSMQLAGAKKAGHVTVRTTESGDGGNWINVFLTGSGAMTGSII